MRRFALILLIFSALGSVRALSAPRLRFSYGLEWGTAVNLYFFENYTFMTDEQYMVNTRFSDGTFHLNGSILATAGIDIAEKCNVSLCAGYQGLAPGFRSYPLSLKASWFINGTTRSNGWFAGALAGMTFDEKFKKKNSHSAQIFAGYRMKVGKKLMLDLKSGIQASVIHPAEFIDHYTGSFVSSERVGSADAYYGALFFMISLNL